MSEVDESEMTSTRIDLSKDVDDDKQASVEVETPSPQAHEADVELVVNGHSIAAGTRIDNGRLVCRQCGISYPSIYAVRASGECHKQSR